jgi:hypothetical protein
MALIQAKQGGKNCSVNNNVKNGLNTSQKKAVKIAG